MRNRRREWLPLLAAVATIGWPAPLRADDWNDVRPDDTSRFSLKSISFAGDFSRPEKELRKAIESSTSGILRFRPVDLDKIEGDVIRLENHFRRLGYWNAEVSRELEFEHERRLTRVTFRIDEGPQRVVGEISVRGPQTYPASVVRSWIKLKEGQPFDLSRTATDRSTIENRYANEGFYEVQVTADIQPADEDGEPAEGTVVHDVVFRVTEGPRYSVGRIRIVGNEFTDRTIIRRELAFETGGVLNRELLLESRARLFSTGYFSRVQIIPELGDPGQNTADVNVKVAERKMRFVAAGVGYGTRDQLRVSAEWGHRNFLGKGKRVSVRGVLASELFPADLVRGRIEGRYVEPWLFQTRTTGIGEVFFERRRELTNSGQNEYDLQLVGLILNLNRRITRFTRTWLTLENEWADIDAAPDVGDVPERPDVTRTFATTVERDRRDDYFDPTKGFLNRVFGSISGGILGGDNDYWRAQFESNWFRPKFGITFAGRVRVGYEQPYGDSGEIPDRNRFKLGGATTVRGYREQTIGPGDFLLLGNVEARFPLFWVLGGALFLDGGNAWLDVKDVGWSDFRFTEPVGDTQESTRNEVRYAAGIGLRINTAVGPVRFDYGWKIKSLPSDTADGRLHFSLGHVF